MRTTQAKSTTLELLPEVTLDKVLVQPLLMHQGLFADVDEHDQPTGKPLRTYIDAAARLDLKGNRDLLRRAKCLQPGGEGGMNDAQSVRSFTGDVCVARYGYVCTTHARLSLQGECTGLAACPHAQPGSPMFQYQYQWGATSCRRAAPLTYIYVAPPSARRNEQGYLPLRA